MSTVSSMCARIRRWYAENKRDLPWRRTRDPYAIWLSEVILQQTRVDQGLAYWHRFMEKCPTVDRLATATEDEVLRLWQGLGYYSRARNLLTAARQVVDQHKGHFPPTYEGLKSLKGVGDYTAAAIGSICFGLPEPTVDGNVYRVLARAFGISTPIDSTEGKREFRDLAARLMDRKEPGEHNQAMMELGATVCTYKDPKCMVCPISSDCVALRDGRIAELPVKAGKTKVRIRHFNYLFVDQGDGTYLQKRTAKDIWQNMYELPLVETDGPITAHGLLQEMAEPNGWTISAQEGPITHILSHQRILAVFWELRPKENVKVPAHWIRVSFRELEWYALPRLIDRWIQPRSSSLLGN